MTTSPLSLPAADVAAPQCRVERAPIASVVGATLAELRVVSLLRCDLMARLELVHAERVGAR